MESQHTPGPWKIYPAGDDDDFTKPRAIGEARCDESPHKLRVADAYAWGSVSERDANARLIAAAPDLLGVLQTIARGACLQQYNGDRCGCYSCLAQTAIAQVTGEEGPSE